MAHVELALLKKHLRVTSTAEDDLIGFYYQSALAWVADYTGLEVFEGTRTLVVAPTETIKLPNYPVQSIVAVSQAGALLLLEDGSPILLEDGSPVLMEDGADSIAFTLDIDINGLACLTLIGDYDTSDVVAIRYRVGYADGELPQPLKQAVLFMVGHFYHNRAEVEVLPGQTAVLDVPEAAKRLCDPYRTRLYAGA